MILMFEKMGFLESSDSKFHVIFVIADGAKRGSGNQYSVSLMID